MASQNNDRRDFSNFGISDFELLGIVNDLTDDDGWTTTFDVRLQVGEAEVKYSGVGSRLSWMRHYGFLEGEGGQWRLTQDGKLFLRNPDLTQSARRALSDLNPAQRLRLAREISQDAAESGWAVRHAIRREWQRNMR